MRPRYLPPWIWGFCWAMLPAAVTSLVVGSRLEPTHALGQFHRPGKAASMSALRTSEALRAGTHLLDLGTLVEGDEVHAEVLVENIWQRSLALQVELQNLPGWSASAATAVLEPGGSTVLQIAGTAGQAGPLNGLIRITSLGDFLSLTVGVTGQIAPKPEEAPAAPPEEAPAAPPEEAPAAPPEEAPAAPPGEVPDEPRSAVPADPEAVPVDAPEVPKGDPEAPPDASTGGGEGGAGTQGSEKG
ncbi:MAG: hypothetical protein ACOY93_07840 [Bacillota bacterium]